MIKPLDVRPASDAPMTKEYLHTLYQKHYQDHASFPTRIIMNKQQYQEFDRSIGKKWYTTMFHGAVIEVEDEV